MLTLMVQTLNDLTEAGADAKKVVQHEDKIRYPHKAPGVYLQPGVCACRVCVWVCGWVCTRAHTHVHDICLTAHFCSIWETPVRQHSSCWVRLHQRILCGCKYPAFSLEIATTLRYSVLPLIAHTPCLYVGLPFFQCLYCCWGTLEEHTDRVLDTHPREENSSCGAPLPLVWEQHSE